jgi:hypothetical protein
MRVIVIVAVLALGSVVVAADEKPVDFARDVRPILQGKCWECHGADKQKGALRLDSRDALLRPAESGGVAVTPGKIDESELIRRLETPDVAERMPLDAPPLTKEKIEILRAWIKEGAKWPESSQAVRTTGSVTAEDRQHWAYLPLRSVPLPAVTDAAWERTSVDRFVSSALAARKLPPNPPASREGLIRRIYFDLVGLPPEPEEVESFSAGQSPDAYERLVDRLLASPHYGERWGRHWLDLARYAESGGLETDHERVNAFRYRDFIIQAINADMPYDQFVRWQLAGDEYEPANLSAVAATGFLTSAPNEMLEEKHLEEERLRLRYNELDDMMTVTASAFLGLTLGCARCHDHKFDAIPTRDYYRLQCAFMTTAAADVKLKDAAQNKEMTLLAITEKSQPADTWLLARGDFYSKKEKLQLGFFSVLTSSKQPEQYLASVREQVPGATTTLQRRALAEWMTDAGQGAGPLLARVMVNRLWQHHFGEGLCRTVSDFGVRSEPPTHPELLEYLTHDFVSGGWTLKRLHRRMVTSAVYMQDDATDKQRLSIDPDNRLLWRRRPQRLEAEVLRDSVLAVSGTLNRQQYGPSFKPPIPAEAIVARNTKDPYPKDAKDTPETRRRSVYMYHKRVTQHPLMQAFDAPDASLSCGRRNSTTVAPQALALLNDPFARDRAADFARRLIAEAGDKPEDWIAHGFRLALSRPPTQSELAASVNFLTQQKERRTARDKSLSADQIRQESLADFCQALFSLNEFIYLD